MKTANIQFLSIGLTLIAMTALQTEARAHSVEDGLRQCAAIAEDDDRLSCFDALAAETTHAVATAPPPTDALAAPAAAVAVAQSDPPPAEPAAGAVPEAEPISDEVGLSRIKGSNTPEPQQYSATVTKCEENKQSGQYYFFLENGQVWKQANYQKLRWRDCEFEVTVAKGSFGYEMHVPEKDRTLRVTRIR